MSTTNTKILLAVLVTMILVAGFSGTTKADPLTLRSPIFFQPQETATLALNSSAPDLQVVAVSNPPATAHPGDKFKITDKTKNFGKRKAGRSVTGYYLSLDTRKGSGDIPLGSRSIATLRTLQVSQGSKIVSITRNTPPGHYFLLACADDQQKVRESHENNNCRASHTAVLISSGLEISPTAQSFGSVAVGSSSADSSFTVTNTGTSPTGPLTVALSGSSDFTTVSNGCSGTLSAGARCIILVHFSPTSAGAKSAVVTLTGTPGGLAQVISLTGTGVPSAALAVATPSQNFVSVALGSSSSSSFTVTNSGGSTSGSLSASLTGSPDFTVVSNGCTGTLAPGATCTFTVRFNPTSIGAKSASLQVTASPGGSAQASLTGTGVAPAALAVATPSQNYGPVAPGFSSAPFSFTVTNSGGVPSGPLTVVLAGSDSDQFTTVSNGCSGTLAPSANCTVVVRFTPTSAGSKSASLTVSATPGGTASATLAGAGGPGLSISPSSQDFEQVVATTKSISVAFTVTNIGGVTSGALSTAFVGADPSEFTIDSNQCTGTLAPGAPCIIRVRFAPTSVGAKSASLQVTGDPGFTTSATLTGTGISPLSISPPSHDYGSVTSGTKGGTFVWTISNSGDIPTGALKFNLQGRDNDQFVMDSSTNTCSGVSLTPGSTCTVQVSFAPTKAGSMSATLQVVGDPGFAASSSLSGTSS